MALDSRQRVKLDAHIRANRRKESYFLFNKKIIRSIFFELIIKGTIFRNPECPTRWRLACCVNAAKSVQMGSTTSQNVLKFLKIGDNVLTKREMNCAVQTRDEICSICACFLCSYRSSCSNSCVLFII